MARKRDKVPDQVLEELIDKFLQERSIQLSLLASLKEILQREMVREFFQYAGEELKEEAEHQEALIKKRRVIANRLYVEIRKLRVEYKEARARLKGLVPAEVLARMKGY